MAIAFGAIATAIGTNDGKLAWFWVFLIFMLCLLPVSVMCVWVFIVDRETIRGASSSPEDNVENVWLSKAAENTMLFTFAAAGLGSAVATFVKPDLTAVSFTLLGVCAFMSITFAVSFSWQKIRQA